MTRKFLDTPLSLLDMTFKLLDTDLKLLDITLKLLDTDFKLLDTNMTKTPVFGRVVILLIDAITIV